MKRLFPFIIASLALTLILSACGGAEAVQPSETGYVLTTGLQDGNLAWPTRTSRLSPARRSR